MKRNLALVEYASSEEESETSSAVGEIDKAEASSHSAASPAPKRSKKLPSLPGHLMPQVPMDNPALHQGRRRTTPHVEGQFAAYVYVPVAVDRRSRLYALLLRVFERAKRTVPSLHPIGFSAEAGSSTSDVQRLEGTKSVSEEGQDAPVELHVSLTRPTYLRAHQREEFKRGVQKAAKSKRRFAASFATLSELTNDERTRTFLALEVGAGHDEFRRLVEELTPTLRSIRQKEFYEDPRFHASIAWALLDGSQPAPLPTPPSQRSPDEAERTSSGAAVALAGETHNNAPSAAVAATSEQAAFPTIPRFPPSLVQELRAEFARELVSPGVGAFEVEEVRVRIGREVSRWRLRDG
ncbi:hypothetical protein BD414DRAFT_498765 [Trametes punicea]|nr:hypothetical protein BD414DRAFT_498765 [Trametes punicea]